MSDKEKKIIEAVAKALPKMDDQSKGYFLGYAEAMADMNRNVAKDKIKDDEKSSLKTQ